MECMIGSLYKPVPDCDGGMSDAGIMRDLLLDFCTSSGGRKPEQIIIFRLVLHHFIQSFFFLKCGYHDLHVVLPCGVALLFAYTEHWFLSCQVLIVILLGID